MKKFNIVSKSKETENLVIFIHGFTGTNDTWEMPNGKRPFIEALLKTKAIEESFNIALFNYESEFLDNEKSNNVIFKFFAEIKRKNTGVQKRYNLSVPKIAQILETEIKLYCAENHLKKVNLSFVAHSMGGLVAKDFICQFHDDEKYVFMQYHSIHVPHRGSEFAILSNIIGDRVQITDLMPNSDLTSQLNRKWNKIQEDKRPRTIYYAAHSDNTVDYNSATGDDDLRSSNINRVPHNGGHSDFLSPLSDDIVLRTVTAELVDGEREYLKGKAVLIKAKATLLQSEIHDGYQNLARINKSCAEIKCLYNSEETINDIVKYVNNFNLDIDDIQTSKLKSDIKYILNTVTLYISDPEAITESDDFKELDNFDYKDVYYHIFEYISANLLKNCQCDTQNSFDNLKAELANSMTLG
jgi:hypothetical protein